MGIELRDITKSYAVGEEESVQALQHISLSIQDGEFCAIMGPSGSGKSTLMNIIGCLDTPTSGTYLLDGKDVSTLDGDALAQVRNRKIGFVFQSFNLVQRTTALENVILPMVYAGVPEEERVQRARAALEVTGLASRVDHYPNQLSGGQQQRVAIARAIVMRPSLILADEPTGQLDTHASIGIMAIFRHLNVQLGITVVVVTHEPTVGEQTSRIIHILDGRLSGDERVPQRHRASAMAHTTAGC